MTRTLSKTSPRAIRLALLGLLAAGVAACGGSSGPPPLVTAPPPPFSASGTIYSSVDFVSFPLPGASVCVFPAGEPCAVTDGEGKFTLDGIPAAVEVALLLTAPGHLGVLLPFPALPSDSGAEYLSSLLGIFSLVTLLSDADAAFLIPFDGGVYPPGNTGYVSFSVFDLSTMVALAGVGVATDAAVGAGPIFFDDFGLPDPALTATSTLGTGSLQNVAPGDAEIAFSRPGYSCSTPSGVALGWVGSSEGFIARTKAPIAAAAVTRVFVTCCPDDRLVADGRFCDGSAGVFAR